MSLKILLIVLINLIILALNIPLDSDQGGIINMILMIFGVPFLILLITLIFFLVFNKSVINSNKLPYISAVGVSLISCLISLYLLSSSFDKADYTSYSQLSIFDKFAPGLFFSLSLLIVLNSFLITRFQKK